LKHPVRTARNMLWLGAELVLAAVSYFYRVRLRGHGRVAQARGLWLQQSSRRILRIFGTRLQAAGPIPKSGLLVCNHLTYLDILVLASWAPCAFVAKREVRGWPVFGWFASLAGTLFVHREKKTDVERMNKEINNVLGNGTLLILFPEGTSSGGDTVLPFKSSLLEPATNQQYPLSAALIGYELSDGSVADEVCYWRDMTFFPHLVNLLSKSSLKATVRFTEIHERSPDRKELARHLHSEVLNLKSGIQPKLLS
jgi:lyso-ornithine lipid O-acyltransferase